MPDPDQAPRAGRPGIPTWRIVAGAYLHFAVPAYLITIPLGALMRARSGDSLQALVQSVPAISGWFLLGYGVLACLSVGSVLLIEPILKSRAARRDARRPEHAAITSERCVAHAVADGLRLLGDQSTPFLDRLRLARWNHADARFRALSSDLAEIVRTSISALETAPIERRAGIAALAAVSLGRIEEALGALNIERARIDEGDAQAVARYVEVRYGPSDFAGDDL